MEDKEYLQLAQLIYEYCGISYFNNLSSLKFKAANRLKELGLSCWEYCGYLRMDPNEWDILIELITVNETYFFREEYLLQEIQSVILPQYRDRSTTNPLKIWCAACSSGEEPYTIAMLVEESQLFESGSVKIIASDINKKVLANAQAAKYNKKSFSFRKMPPGALAKFFIESEEDYQVKDSIKEMVEFRRINLYDDFFAELSPLDIVVCRNVLIYFDKPVSQKIITSFYNVLKPGGYLFLGHSESLSMFDHHFQTIYTENLFYYKKEGNPL